MMRRVNFYITDAEYHAVRALAVRSGQSFAAVLREAIDRYVSQQSIVDPEVALLDSFGCWAGTGEFDLRSMRNEWEQRLERR